MLLLSSVAVEEIKVESAIGKERKKRKKKKRNQNGRKKNKPSREELEEGRGIFRCLPVTAWVSPLTPPQLIIPLHSCTATLPCPLTHTNNVYVCLCFLSERAYWPASPKTSG